MDERSETPQQPKEEDTTVIPILQMRLLKLKIPHLWSGKVGLQTQLVSGSKASTLGPAGETHQ